MCEIFGFSSSEEVELNDYLKNFYSHCEEHPHGWGLAILDDDKFKILKEPVKARSSVMLGNILLNPIICKNSIAHIRLATIGNLEFYNCHPFVKKDLNGRTWTLIHNGTIFDCPDLCKYSTLEEGETDSERVLLHIIENVNCLESSKGEPLSLKERFDVVSTLIEEMSCTNKLNLILSDGEQMYVHTNFKNSLHCLKKGSSIMFSTQPLSYENWEKVPINKTFSFFNGELLFESDVHVNEYVETEAQLNFIEKFIESLKKDMDEEYAW